MVNYQGSESVIDDATTALIGSDASSTIRIVRPGISRRHAVISRDDKGWRIEDAGSRNGTFVGGKRIHALAIDEPVTLYLGHPSDGEVLTMTPLPGTTKAEERKEAPPAEPEVFDLPPVPPPAAAAAAPRTQVQERQPKPATPKPRQDASPSAARSASDVEVAQLTAAIRDQISAIKGLTWSVWAMIAVTAALIVLTLFVGILSN